MALLSVGDKAPAFRTRDQDGNAVSLGDFKGRKLVLYFYPKDDTPGCTKEACSFKDDWARFRKRNIAVLGVSADDVKSHEKFAQKYSLPFRLLADTDKTIVNDYSVWGEKSMYGRKYMGIERTTFVIDEKGKIAKIFAKVKPEGHAAQVLEALAD